MALTENAIVEQVPNQLSFLKNYPKNVTENLIEIIKSNLESGDNVLVSGFGKSCVKEKVEILLLVKMLSHQTDGW